jgi:acyl-CoA thioesterase
VTGVEQADDDVLDRAAEGGPDTSLAAQLAAVAPDPAGTPGRYCVDVAAHWRCPVVPQGGVMAALAARAMALELGDPALALRTLTTVFAAAVPHGPATVDVEVLRRGRSASQVTATLRAEGQDAGHTTVAVFGRSRTGFAFTDRRRPDVPPPHECPSFDDPLPEGVEDDGIEVPFWGQAEGRPALGHPPWEEYVPERSDCAYWYRLHQPPRRPDGTLDPLMAVVLADLMPSTVGERIGPGGPPAWWAPSTDLTIHLLAEPRSEWLLAHLTTNRAGDGYASADAALWDPEAGLVAKATQVMFFTFPEPPTADQLVPADQR